MTTPIDDVAEVDTEIQRLSFEWCHGGITSDASGAPVCDLHGPVDARFVIFFEVVCLHESTHISAGQSPSRTLGRMYGRYLIPED